MQMNKIRKDAKAFLKDNDCHSVRVMPEYIGKFIEKIGSSRADPKWADESGDSEISRKRFIIAKGF